MTTTAFNSIMASLDSPMAVVTTAMDGERAGCLVGFHAQSSIDPSRACVWLSKANHTYRVLLRATHLAVHYLSDRDRDLAELFGTLSGDDVDKFSRCESSISAYGVPILTRCPNRIIARRIVLLDEGGDHVMVVLDPLDVSAAGPFTPLRLSQVADLRPGHEAEERPSPPTERSTELA